MDNSGKTNNIGTHRTKTIKIKTQYKDAQREPHQRPGMDPFDDEGKLDIMLTKFIQISFEINSCHPWIVHSWLPSKVVSIVYLSVMDIHIFLFFIAKHVYSWEASQNVFSRFVINTWITYFYLCFISFKIFFFLLLSYSLLH
jgi:hypothetical protein